MFDTTTATVIFIIGTLIVLAVTLRNIRKARREAILPPPDPIATRSFTAGCVGTCDVQPQLRGDVQ